MWGWGWSIYSYTHDRQCYVPLKSIVFNDYSIRVWIWAPTLIIYHLTPYDGTSKTRVLLCTFLTCRYHYSRTIVPSYFNEAIFTTYLYNVVYSRIQNNFLDIYFQEVKMFMTSNFAVLLSVCIVISNNSTVELFYFISFWRYVTFLFNEDNIVDIT